MLRSRGALTLSVVVTVALSGLAQAQRTPRPQAVATAEAALDRAQRGGLPAAGVAAARAYASACAQAWGAEAIQTTRCRLRLGEALTDNEDNAEATGLLNDIVARLAAAGPAEAEHLARAQSSLGEALTNLSRYSEAEAVLTAALSAQTERSGDAHLDTFRTLRRLASLRVFQFKLAEAEALAARSEAAAARAAIPAADRAFLLAVRGRLADRLDKPDEAEQLLRQSLSLMDEAFSRDDPRRGFAMSTLVGVLNTARRSIDEAEAVARRNLEIDERAYAPLDPRLGVTLNNLATVLQNIGRLEESEALMRRSVLAVEAAEGPNSTRLAFRLFNHAFALSSLGRRDEAEALLRRSIDIYAQSPAPNSLRLANSKLELAFLRRAAGDFVAAESLAGEALEMRRAAFGDAHDLTIENLRELGRIQLASGHADRAEATLRAAAESAPKVYGSDGYETALVQSWLGAALLAQGRTEEAWRQALAAMQGGLGGAAGVTLRNSANTYFAALEQVLEVVAKRPPRREVEREALFDIMQTASRSHAGVAAVRAAARLAEADPGLAAVDARVRALRLRVSQLERQNAQAYGSSNAVAILESGAELAEARAAFAAAQQELSRRRPHFAEIAGRQSFHIADVNGENGALRDGEGMLLAAQMSARLHLMLITRDRVRFESVALTQEETASAVSRLRAGLRLEGVVSPSDLPEFDLAAGHDLYRRIIGPFQRELRGLDTLYVVPDGPLASIPFSLLVAAPAPPQANTIERYRRTRFLGDEVALATLPSPASLVAGRRHVRPSHAQRAFFAFADPALSGTENVRTLTRWVSLRNGLQAATASARNAAALCRLSPLPDTRREALAIAAKLGSGAGDVLLGRAASERALHELNASGALAQRRIILFATHGLVSGDDSGVVEPALVLTPPESCAATTESEDGLLTASEVVSLTLDADWVILSGCNTAAPDERTGAAPLSGLARAFLYAGARRLLVSHWSVDSEAAADLTSALFDPRNRNLAPAAALREAMRTVRESEGAQAYRAHPAFWAPFVLVGDGR